MTQFLSTTFGVSLGKFNTTEGDPNPFASDERDTFMNLSLVLPTVALRTLPDSALGGALIWLPCEGVTAEFLALDSEGKADRSGKSTIDDNGTTALVLLARKGGLLDLPGGQRLGATWGNKDYAAADQDGRLPILAAALTGRPVERDDGSWCVFLDGWQYAQTFTGGPDLGWGVFWRIGFGDEDTNPIATQWAGGVGGKSGLFCRPNDAWGVGAYYLDLSRHLRAAHLTDEKGIEAFYSVGITPWMHVTPSIQVIDPGIREFDTTVIGSLRLQIDF
jgi:porin